ncbi:MAG TPA: carboxypeptidase regulatory-like domain-containing protein [Pyrinomonadaceae bacterium]|nr:carboxypeptidase regulatory-like domain-containing protein [Pyrinomonadaceae bacterium]
MRLLRARSFVALLVALCLLTFAAACGRGDDDEEDDGPAGPEAADTQLTPYASKGNEGSIAGVVNFSGAAPEARAISMSQDSVCESSNPTAKSEDVVVNGDKLQNVFVYLKDGRISDGQKGLNTLSFNAPSEPAVLDQKGCQYVPHVVGVMTRQKLSVLNSDQTAHNVNVQATRNEGFNSSQTAGQPPIEKTFLRAETLIPVKCNQHPWMRAYIGVLGHPFFAITGPEGKFEIKNVPPGTYTLVAWHERFKEKTLANVTVGASETKGEQNFTFDAAAALNELDGGSFTVLPALELPSLAGGRHH